MEHAHLLPLARRVRTRRTELELTEEAAARVAGLSNTTWSNIETAKVTPRPVTAAKVCRALGWSPDSLQRILAGAEPLRLDAEVEPPAIEVDARLTALEHVAEVLQGVADEIRALVEQLRQSP